MFTFLDKYNFIKGQAALGVELVFTNKDSYTLIAVELTGNKEGLEVTNRYVNLTLEQLATENKKNIPLYFSINGKGVIHKKVKYDEYTKENELIHQILPNASVNDFYIQKSILSTNECWVSIVRKEVLDKIVSEINSFKLFGVKIYLGPFALESSIQLIDESTLITSSHELIIADNKIIQIDGLGSVSGGLEYHIDGENISSHELIAFATALTHFAPVQNLQLIENEEISFINEEYINKNKFKAIGITLLSFFFLIAISNLMVFSSLQAVNNDLQYQVNSKKTFVIELNQLKKELDTKQQFIANSGVAQASKISFFTDQIALDIPKSIQLNELFVNPLNKRINKAEDIYFNYNVIKVKGNVNRGIELNNWVKKLKELDWVAGISIISFVQNNLKTAGEFELEITVNS